MSGILTYSGRLVALSGAVNPPEPPSIGDIGLALSRIPRFAGHTRRWWTVAHHVLWLEDYGRYNGLGRDARLGILLHDAHEAVTGDIPTPFKNKELRDLQRALDRGIFGRYHPLFWYSEEIVKYYDQLGLMAEAVVVGPPALDLKADSARAQALLDSQFGGLPIVGDDNKYLRDWIHKHVAFNHPDGEGAPALEREFVRRVVDLL
jgi:hypothetical protein